MAGKSPSAARDAYLGPLQKALACISPAVLIHNSFEASTDNEYFINLPGANPIRVPCSKGQLHYQIRIEQRFRIVHVPADKDTGPYKVSTRKYEYALDDDEGHEIVAFHWHPREQGFDGTHLHLSSGAGTLISDLHRAYVPTGRITVEDFILFVIRDFGVTVRDGNYKKTLDGSKSRFDRFKTW